MISFVGDMKGSPYLGPSARRWAKYSGCLEQLGPPVALNVFFLLSGDVPCLYILKSEKLYLACATGVPGATVKHMGGKDAHVFYSKREKEWHISLLRKFKS